MKDMVVRAKVLKNMGCIMHDVTQPDEKTPLKFAKEELLKLMEIIPYVQVFWLYVILEWVLKCEMWVMRKWNFPYAG
jgi:hypothetical protein